MVTKTYSQPGIRVYGGVTQLTNWYDEYMVCSGATYYSYGFDGPPTSPSSVNGGNGFPTHSSWWNYAIANDCVVHYGTPDGPIITP